MKTPEYCRGKEQTYVKHFFLEQYLETVSFHIGYTQREFVYVDCPVALGGTGTKTLGIPASAFRSTN
jgi:hypothetical protein